MSAPTVAPLERSELEGAARLLAVACPFDRASDVAEEKLFGAAPAGPSKAFGAWIGGDLVGVAAVSARWLRLVAVAPKARKRGAGSALLGACEREAAAFVAGLPTSTGKPSMRVLDQPGNYLAPGVDVRNRAAISWLEKRGFSRGPDLRANVLIDVRGNERVSAERLAESIVKARKRGYDVRRAGFAEREALMTAISAEFGGAWDFEIERAMRNEIAGVHVAVKDGAYCAFAAHDGNNSGLGWFGPTGTWPAHRGQGLGEATLLACLLDVAERHAQCEVAWIGPRPFYDKVAGVAADRSFVTLTKAL